MPSSSQIQAAQKQIRPADYAMILATVVIWGGSFAATKLALSQAEPMVVLFLRLAIGMPVLFIGVCLEGSLRLPTKGEALTLFLMGFQGIFFHQAIQSYAMKTAGAANANWMMPVSAAAAPMRCPARAIAAAVALAPMKPMLPISTKRQAISSTSECGA